MPAQTGADWTKFWELIKDIKFAMFTAHGSDGHMHSRPMTMQNGSDDRADVLWFFMSRSSEPVLDIARDASVNVAYADTGSDAYVSVAGRARLVDDIAKKKALWNTGVQAWFPGGVTDPDLALVAVTIEHVEYWDVDSNKMVQLFKITKAAMTGVPPKMGEHRELRTRSAGSCATPGGGPLMVRRHVELGPETHGPREALSLRSPAVRAGRRRVARADRVRPDRRADPLLPPGDYFVYRRDS